MTSTDLPDEGGVREAIARIIDPEAWESFQLYQRHARACVDMGHEDTATLWIELSHRIAGPALAKADAILALFPVEGWVLVPVEPTEAMIEAAKYHWGPWIDAEKTQRAGRYAEGDGERERAVWAQMIKAAPPLQGGGGEAAWLVEMPGPVYARQNSIGSWDWTQAHDSAFRFAGKEEAERWRDTYHPDAKVAEHMWVSL